MFNFVVHIYISHSCSYFVSPVLLLNSCNLCHTYQLVIKPLRKKKIILIAKGRGKYHEEVKLILAIRHFEGGFTLYNTSKISGKLFQINLCVLQLNF